METIFLFRHLMEKYWEAYEDFHMVFVDLEIRLPREAREDFKQMSFHYYRFILRINI